MRAKKAIKYLKKLIKEYGNCKIAVCDFRGDANTALNDIIAYGKNSYPAEEPTADKPFHFFMEPRQ